MQPQSSGSGLKTVLIVLIYIMVIAVAAGVIYYVTVVRPAQFQEQELTPTVTSTPNSLDPTIDPNNQDPSAPQFAEARDNKRELDITNILNAASQYETLAENSLGELPTCPVSVIIGTSELDLSVLVPDYLAAIPQDPLVGTPADTGYTLCRTSDAKLRVSAPLAENAELMVEK